MRRLCGLIVAVVLLPALSWGQSQGFVQDARGTAVRAACQATLDRMQNKEVTTHAQQQSSYCFGLVEGLITMHKTATLRGLEPLFCVPDSVTVEQGISVIVAWLHRHTDQLEQPGSALLVQALQDSYPCQ
jgi:Rap1a immunity proteins